MFSVGRLRWSWGYRTGARLPDDLQPFDNLPEGWYRHVRPPATVTRTRRSRSTICSAASVGSPRSTSSTALPNPTRTKQTIGGRWRYIEHDATHTRHDPSATQDIHSKGGRAHQRRHYLPWRADDPITSQLLPELPSGIGAAINTRRFAIKRAETITGSKIALPSGHKSSERDPLNRLGAPKTTPDFLRSGGPAGRPAPPEQEPSATTASINDLAPSTAKGWITKARDRGLRPPERQVRAGYNSRLAATVPIQRAQTPDTRVSSREPRPSAHLGSSLALTEAAIPDSRVLVTVPRTPKES